MPLVRISLVKGKPAELRRRIGNLALAQLTVSAGRTLAQKRALFRKIADGLTALGLRREDAWVNLVEVARENWSFGNGVASYAPAETATAW